MYPAGNLFIPATHGRLEAIYRPKSNQAEQVALVLHPHPLHGGTMHNKVVFRVAKALNECGFETLRFNFRGVGLSTGEFDEGRGECADAQAALDYLLDNQQNAREVINLPGEMIRELPTARNVNSLLELTPGITNRYRPTGAFGAPGVCVGGIGVFCNPGIDGFNVGDMGTATDVSNLAQGRVMVDGQVINQAGSLPLGGMTGGYTADVANAQEININAASFTLFGSLPARNKMRSSS